MQWWQDIKELFDWTGVLRQDWWWLIAALLVTTALAAIITPLIIKLYRRQNWLQQPEKKAVTAKFKATHEKVVPRGGGLAILAAVLIGGIIFLRVDSVMALILVGAILLALVGFLDDLFDVHPVVRLVVNIVAAVLVVIAGVSVKFINNPFGAGVIHFDSGEWWLNLLSVLGTIFLIVWNINIVNWSKGVDGQMPGFVAIAALFLGALSLRFWGDQSNLVFNNTVLSMIVAGAFGGFLIWNFYPQKIMPGYGGGALGGYFLSVLAILSGAKVATVLMILAVPTADAVFTISRRLIAGKSPFWGDRGHLHHKLLDTFGWGRRRIAIFYWLISLLMGILSLFLNTQGKIIAICLAVILTFTFLIWAKIKNLRKNQKKMVE